MTGEPGTSVTCPYCLKGVGNMQGLSRHTRAMHPDQPPAPMLTDPPPRFADPACKGHPITLWYPPSDLVGNSSERRRMVAQAREICMGCPHRTPCADYALAHPLDTQGGMWGGLTPDELATRRRTTSTLTCPTCHRQIATRYGLERHMRRAHRTDQEGTG